MKNKQLLALCTTVIINVSRGCSGVEAAFIFNEERNSSEHPTSNFTVILSWSRRVHATALILDTLAVLL